MEDKTESSGVEKLIQRLQDEGLAKGRNAAEELGTQVERCLMVGDTTGDMWAARSAGARSAGVLCGFGEQDELERAGADLILKTTTELGDWM